jgi:hypothetical protein
LLYSNKIIVKPDNGSINLSGTFTAASSIICHNNCTIHNNLITSGNAQIYNNLTVGTSNTPKATILYGTFSVGGESTFWNKSTFKKPEFDKNASENIASDLYYQNRIIKVTDNYSLYIDPEPIINNNSLIINLISMETNNIWIKVRVLKDKEVVAETGLIKPGQYLEKVQLKKKLDVNDEIVYMVMGYEKESYLSAGTIKLNTRIGE